MMQYNIPDIKETFLLKLAVFVYKQVSLNYDVFFNKFLNRTTGYSLRHTYVVVDRPRTNYGMQMIDYLIMKLCNDYPDVISIAKSCRNVHKFKSSARILFHSANELSLQWRKFVCSSTWSAIFVLVFHCIGLCCLSWCGLLLKIMTLLLYITLFYGYCSEMFFFLFSCLRMSEDHSCTVCCFVHYSCFCCCSSGVKPSQEGIPPFALPRRHFCIVLPKRK